MDEFVALTPVNFFQINVDCYRVDRPFPKISTSNLRTYLLPDLTDLCEEAHFAQVAMGWNAEGIEAHVVVSQAFQRVTYPDITRGDSVELFFDTRDVKTSGFNTRFCHHFFFLPEAVDEHQAGEITRFRTEDTHELCDPKELKVKAQLKSNSYQLQIFIPSHCLHGYDTDQFDRLGFTYRINRPDGPSQHFSVVTDDYQVEQQPSLWSSVRLVK